VFNGYAFFAGNEIFNSARTRAYVSNIRPNFGLISRHADQDLRVILGDEEYDTPAMDGAPWYDASRPHSADFWGMYPLTVSGVEDGTREVQSTELIDDGSVSTLARHASKEFRVTGLLVGILRLALMRVSSGSRAPLRGRTVTVGTASATRSATSVTFPTTVTTPTRPCFPIVLSTAPRRFLTGSGKATFRDRFLICRWGLVESASACLVVVMVPSGISRTSFLGSLTV